MNRLTLVGLTLTACAIAAGCGDDSSTSGSGGSGGGSGGSGSGSTTTATTGTGNTGGGDTGGGDAGGGDTGGGGTGGNLEGGCGGPGECGESERCEFPDGLCGTGERGVCVPRSDACSDIGNELVCLCSGELTDMDWSCDDDDRDVSGSCALPADTFACGDHVCEVGQGTYCRITSDDTGGPPYAGCGQTEDPACQEPTCACLTAETEACSGTCEDGPDAPTIHCPGG